MKKYLFILIFAICSLLASAQSDSIAKKVGEIDSAVTLYGQQLVVANYISIISFTTVIVGTLCSAPFGPLLLVTGICDGVTLLVSGKAANRLANRKNRHR